MLNLIQHTKDIDDEFAAMLGAMYKHKQNLMIPDCGDLSYNDLILLGIVYGPLNPNEKLSKDIPTSFLTEDKLKNAYKQKQFADTYINSMPYQPKSYGEMFLENLNESCDAFYKSINAFTSSFKFQVGVGAGLRIGGEIPTGNTNLGFTAGGKVDYASIILTDGKIDIGYEEKHGLSGSFGPINGSMEEGIYHSYLEHNCPLEGGLEFRSIDEYRECPECISYDGGFTPSIGIGVEGYIEIGGSASIEFEYQKFLEKIEEIYSHVF